MFIPKQGRKEWRQFGYGGAIILTILAVINMWRGHSTATPWMLGTALFLSLTATLSPVMLKPLTILFIWLGEIMGFVMTRVILTLLFYGILTPISWISKLTGKKYLIMGPDSECETYWEKMDEDPAEHIEQQF